MSIFTSRFTSVILSVFLCALLASCGGSGTSNPNPYPVVSSLSFPVKTAIANLVQNGYVFNFSVSGFVTLQPISGSGSITQAPAVSGIFEGTTGLKSVCMGSVSINNGGTITVSSLNGADYVDTNYLKLGYESSSSYEVVTTIVNLPSKMKVGDSIYSYGSRVYSDSKKTTLNEYLDVIYTAEADTASTMILAVQETGRNNFGTQTNTTTTRYRIDSLGGITILSSTITNLVGSNIKFTAL